MNLLEVYFGFHRPYASNYRGWFGHVEAWGYTEDDNWLFIDPQMSRTRLYVCHRHDDVVEMMAVRYETCESILKIRPTGQDFRFPVHFPMTCAAICGHLVGLRAFTPAGLRRKLLANGAEVIHGQAEGRSRGQEGQTA